MMLKEKKFSTKREKMDIKKSGYTLVEVVLVMSFVSISFLALFGIFAKTIQGDTESRNEIIASNLAQECIERVRNCRDNEVLANPAWSISSLGGDCSLAVVPISIFFSNAKRFDTSFTVINGPTSTSKIVTCETSWSSSLLQTGAQRKVTIKSLLSDWQKQ